MELEGVGFGVLSRQGAIVIELVSIVKKAAPKQNSGIKWAQPVFWNSAGPFCFIRAHKNHVNIGFWRGAQLDYPKGLLEGSGGHCQIF